MNWIKNSLLVVGSILLTIFAIEIGLRLVTISGQQTTGTKDVGMYHDLLGWVTKPGAQGKDRQGNTVTILSDGTRSNDAIPLYEENRPILAVGDSFVFGDEVRNHETWPAQLEKMLGKRVVNAGVNGYGIDQSTLRAEELVEKLNPSLLIFSFYADDIMRCGMSKRHKNKPFFELNNESLVLRNVPVPNAHANETVFLRFLKSKSALVRKLLPDHDIEIAHKDHEQVSAMLLDRISDFAKERNVPVIFLAQYNDLSIEEQERVDRVFYYVRDEKYSHLIDSYGYLNTVLSSDKQVYKNLFITFTQNGEERVRHMSPQGNWIIAKLIRDNLKKLLLVPI